MPHIGVKKATDVYRLWINLTQPSLSVPEGKSSAHQNLFPCSEKITLRLGCFYCLDLYGCFITLIVIRNHLNIVNIFL